jgi:hypothetical protein
MAVDPELGSLRSHGGASWTAPTDHDAASANGDDVLADAVRACHDALGNRLVASYALGSLAHSGFSSLVSDVDLALILADPIEASDAATLLRTRDIIE